MITEFAAHPFRVLLHYGSCKENQVCSALIHNLKDTPTDGHDSAGDCVSLDDVFHSLINSDFLCVDSLGLIL
jgi:hypothetical protein